MKNNSTGVANNMERNHVFIALIYAFLGVGLGIKMAATHDHGQLVTHAHIMLLGFVVSFLYGVTHRLWLQRPASLLAKAQFYLHHLGSFAVIAGLFLLYGNFVPGEKLEVFLAISSMVVLLALLLMLILFVQSKKPSLA